MFLVNLTLLEFLGVFALLGGATVTLYLLTKSRRRFTVSTLKFWQDAGVAPERHRRKRIDQPWSLLMQLLALALLLLAIAQPRLGRPDSSGRDHVLVLDTSAWMAAQGPRGTLESDAIRQSLRWLRNLPAQDRVMVIRAGALATPATPFETDRAKVEAAVRQARPGPDALDIEQAFSLAAQAQRLQSANAGEIVYVGAGRLSGAESRAVSAPPNLRVLQVEGGGENAGLTRVVLRRSVDDADVWQAFISAKNYGRQSRSVPLTVAMGGAVVASRMMNLPPRSEATATVEIRTRAAGWLEARLEGVDSLASDNEARIEVPAQPVLRVAVFSPQPDLLRPLLAADKRVQAEFLPLTSYQPDADGFDLYILDRVAPSSAPRKPAVWIQPPPHASPIPARRSEATLELAKWNANHPVAVGLRTRDVKLTGALLLSPNRSDVAVAEARQGTLIAARADEPRAVVLGFHPVLTSLRYELATPLLMANILHWIAPGAFLQREVLADSPGAIAVDLGEIRATDSIRVIDESGTNLPFTREGRTVRFFAPERGVIRVTAGPVERVFSLSLPALGSVEWEVPSTTARGVGAPVSSSPLPREFWHWLAIAGVAIVALEWWLFGRRNLHRRSHRIGLALKVLAVVAVLASVFEPALTVNEKKLAVGVLVDTSASVSDQDLAGAAALVAKIDDKRGRHQVRVLPFASGLRGAPPLTSGERWRLSHASGEEGRSTSIEGAIRESIATMPAGLVPRLVLISDGRETQGSAVRAAHQARELGIPVDTYVLQGRPEPKLKLQSVRLPPVAFTGEKVPIDVTLESPAAAAGEIEISAEGKALGRSPIELQQGVNQIRVTASIATPGAIDLNGVLRAGDLGELRFEQAVSIRRPRVLYASMDPAGQGMEAQLLQTLASAQFDMVTSADVRRARLDEFQIVVLNNYDIESITPDRKADLERYVQRGGGLLVIGGERNIFVEKKQKNLDALDRALPATVAPPRSPEGTAVVLIVDKSSSMEGRKMELARIAAIGVVENLRPIDYVGVLIFDNSHQWAVPIRRAEDRTLIKRLIAGITPDGGTQIAPALAEAYNRMARATGAFKHIVLLTDGISEEGNSMEVATAAAQNRVTISTVGLGQDVNRAYLEKVATTAKGKAYVLTDPSGLEQILLKDVMEHTGSTTVEKPITPRVKKQTELLAGVNMETAPALRGYVRFEAKPQADTVLALDGSNGKEDPLLSRWQYGLGRAAVFTSDAKSRWAASWIGWPGYDKFWTNLMRDLLPHAQSEEARITHDAANGVLVAEYRLAAHVPEPAQPPALYVLGPNGFQATVLPERAGKGYFRARVPIGARDGLFRIRPLAEVRAFPEIGIYLPEQELATYGNNPVLLRQISEYTGGLANADPGQIFNTLGRFVPTAMRLWPGLLALAILLNLLEIAWRRIRLA